MSRVVGPWLLCRLVCLLEESAVSSILEDWYDYTSDDVAAVLPYVDVGFSGCWLLITVIISCKHWLSNAVMHRFVSNVLVVLTTIARSHGLPRSIVSRK